MHTFVKTYFYVRLHQAFETVVLLEITRIERQKRKKEKYLYTHARLLHYTQLLTVTYSSGKPYLTVS